MPGESAQIAASALYWRLADAGLRLRLGADGQLLVSPKGKVVPADAELIRQQRDDLVALLRGDPAAGCCRGCHRPLDERGCCWKCCDRLCELRGPGCMTWTASAFIASCLACDMRRTEPSGEDLLRAAGWAPFRIKGSPERCWHKGGFVLGEASALQRVRRERSPAACPRCGKAARIGPWGDVYFDCCDTR